MVKKTSATAAAESHAPPPGEGLPQMLSILAMDTSDGNCLPPGKARASRRNKIRNQMRLSFNSSQKRKFAWH
uniref:Uncharacterized protein n=1 Tax=Caenorhabditis japonica TaxID=281687 RepID=A0A8R1IBZ0_CAEJA